MAKASTHGGGRIGGPCDTITTAGHWCRCKATMVVDGHGYCKRHAPAKVGA